MSIRRPADKNRRQRRRRAKKRTGNTTPVEIIVEKLGAHGDGIAKDASGSRLYIPFTTPGDKALVIPGDRQGDGIAARLVEIIQPGADRISPFCKYFGVCGGCALQHINRAAYQDWKRALVLGALGHRGFKDVDVAPVVSIPHGSRRRATFAVTRQDRKIEIGFRGRSSHKIVAIENCPLLTPALNRILAPTITILAETFTAWRTGQITVTGTHTGLDMMITVGQEPDLSDRERLAQFANDFDIARLSWMTNPDDEPEPLIERRQPEVIFDGVHVPFPAGAFLQPGSAGETALAGEIIKGLEGCTRVADLFAGLGTFSFPLANAETARTVHAIDADSTSIASLTLAAGRARLGGRVSGEVRDLHQRPLAGPELKKYDGIVFDPPRSGALAVVRELATAGPPRIVAVSCNPATFSRDARVLVDGGYRIERVTPFDQFPYSHHVEITALFSR